VGWKRCASLVNVKFWHLSLDAGDTHLLFFLSLFPSKNLAQKAYGIFWSASFVFFFF
jgi:lipid-A-disaccharide synthase-like uncharacterized protein